MIYRELGKTGMRVGIVGMGCEGFLEKTPEQVSEFIDVMQAHGANCIDLYSPNPDMRKNLGLALQGRRQDFILQSHLCSVWEDGQYKRTRKLEEVKAGLAQMLELLATDYIDIGMIHYVDALSGWEEVIANDVLDYALELKEKGIIRAVGLSSHNPIAAQKAVETGKIDVLMFSVNPCYDLQPGDEDLELLWADESYEKQLINMDPDREKLYETCQAMGVGITVMKAFGGGDLLDKELSPAAKELSVYQCMRYALDRPAVATIMSGARKVEELLTCFGYCDAEESQTDYAAALAAFPKISWEGHCMYCGHCAPCPVGISVADVTKFLNLTIAQGGVPETVREHYAVLPVHASACIGCGACETRCPFHVSIRENMKKAAEVFGE